MAHRQGFTLVAAVFILLVMTLLAITTSTYISSDSVIAVKNYHSLDVFYIAVAGLEYYTKLLEDDTDWSSPPTDKIKSFRGGVFVITTTNESTNSITVTGTAYLTVEGVTYTRTLQPYIIRSGGGGGLGGIAGEYLLYWGTGGGGGGGGDPTEVENNVTITGGVLVDASLDIGNNVLLSGDAYATGNIDLGHNSQITGTTETNTTLPASPPSLETSVYDSQVATAETYPSGDWKIKDPITLSGYYYIDGKVKIEDDVTITGTATIVATGKVEVKNNVNIGDNLTVISGDKIKMGNSVVIGSGGLWYSAGDFETGNNIQVGRGGSLEGSVFIGYEEIELGNNADYYGLVFSGGEMEMGNNTNLSGLIVANYVEEIGNNSVLRTNANTLDWSSVPGVSGGGVSGNESIDVNTWDEVY